MGCFYIFSKNDFGLNISLNINNFKLYYCAYCDSQIKTGKMEEQQFDDNIKNFIDSDLFRDMENKVISEAISEASKSARRELELFKFEIVYPEIVSKKEREEIENEITNFREKKWQEALKKADGDKEKALMLV